ncbi:hypothetical protein TNCV_4560081 [Trichonephila clavipes]|nr:hypothetical protein TNCV_4560081 [Trichonephila clavipes]
MSMGGGVGSMRCPYTLKDFEFYPTPKLMNFHDAENQQRPCQWQLLVDDDVSSAKSPGNSPRNSFSSTGSVASQASSSKDNRLHAEIVEVQIEVVSPSIVPSGNFAELNRTVTCMLLKANDRCTSCPCHDEFRVP